VQVPVARREAEKGEVSLNLEKNAGMTALTEKGRWQQHFGPIRRVVAESGDMVWTKGFNRERGRRRGALEWSVSHGKGKETVELLMVSLPQCRERKMGNGGVRHGEWEGFSGGGGLDGHGWHRVAGSRGRGRPTGGVIAGMARGS
jgi:hypothetical protein